MGTWNLFGWLEFVSRHIDISGSAAAFQHAIAERKDLLEAVHSLASIIALGVGGVWAYNAFIRKRETYPRANVSHRIMHRSICSEKTLLRVAVYIENPGDVLLSLAHGMIRIQEMSPWLTSLKQISVSPIGYAADGDTEIAWPRICEREFRWKSGEREIEPGETDECHFDFVIDASIDTVLVYTYFRNHSKLHRQIGWNTTNVYSLAESTNDRCSPTPEHQEVNMSSKGKPSSPRPAPRPSPRPAPGTRPGTREGTGGSWPVKRDGQGKPSQSGPKPPPPDR